jgi:hypothetical protein
VVPPQDGSCQAQLGVWRTDVAKAVQASGDAPVTADTAAKELGPVLFDVLGYGWQVLGIAAEDTLQQYALLTLRRVVARTKVASRFAFVLASLDALAPVWQAARPLAAGAPAAAAADVPVPDDADDDLQSASTDPYLDSDVEPEPQQLHGDAQPAQAGLGAAHIASAPPQAAAPVQGAAPQPAMPLGVDAAPQLPVQADEALGLASSRALALADRVACTWAAVILELTMLAVGRVAHMPALSWVSLLAMSITTWRLASTQPRLLIGAVASAGVSAFLALRYYAPAWIALQVLLVAYGSGLVLAAIPWMPDATLSFIAACLWGLWRCCTRRATGSRETAAPARSASRPTRYSAPRASALKATPGQAAGGDGGKGQVP